MTHRFLQRAAAHASLALAAASATPLAQAGWMPTLVQAPSGQTFLQVVNDQGQAAGQARTGTGLCVGRRCDTVVNRGIFVDQQQVVDDPVLWARTGFSASAINQSGQLLVGASLYSGGQFSALAGSPADLNNAGQVATTVLVGPFLGTSSVFHAGLQQADGSVLTFGTLGGLQSKAYALNASGQVVGWGQVPSTNGAIHGMSHAVLRDGNGLLDLGALLDAGTSSIATDINDAGTVIGSLSTTQGMRAFVYHGGAARVLPLAGDGQSTGYNGSTTANALNARGQVLYTTCSLGALCEVLLDDQGQVSNLGRLAGFDSTGVALNDRGQALLSANINGDTDYGLWDQGQLLNLDSLVAPLGFTDVAFATLANGWLAGFGSLASGQTQSFLLRDTSLPVPEPSSLWLVVAAALALGRQVKRRQAERPSGD